ncbi:hypothetical protein [Corynebacterium sp. HMSC29G08]|uniref:hypothetical protein n=1 Tax=Corynebacterium sp. HMSC29G08 TaxID=1581069 RepID=UPI0008A1FCFA|nr:hypothetical protein [Corynebacterium sp. HMSC29G08]OFT83732.1 hypothetical protein HMPREF3101_05705 [Corynebacterium sp. HMSC29G08]
MHAPKIAATIAAVTLSLTLAACSGDAETDTTTTSTATEESTSQEAAPAAPAAQLPSADELNGVLQRAADPNLPIEERMLTVQGGESVPELFGVMTQSQLESGAQFQVVDPVLADFEPNQVLAPVNLTAPDTEPTLINDVMFVHEDGHWKLSQQWACNLISSTLPQDQVPEMCAAGAPVAPAPVNPS